LSKEKYFSKKEYLIGDSAFSASMAMVPAFKNGPTDTLSKHKSTSKQSWQKSRLRVNFVFGSSRPDFNMYNGSGGL